MDLEERWWPTWVNWEFQLITEEKSGSGQFRIHLGKLHTPQDCTGSFLHAVFDFLRSSFSIPAFDWASKDRKPCSTRTSVPWSARGRNAMNYNHGITAWLSENLAGGRGWNGYENIPCCGWSRESYGDSACRLFLILDVN